MRKKKEKTTIETITQHNIELIAGIEKNNIDERTRGQRIADKFASVVGSWPFIIVQSLILFMWICANVYFVKNGGLIQAWDKYPFILLNLALSFQAAYTGPIVMMSANRQSQLSEQRKHLDMQVNLLAEEENTIMLKILVKLAEKQGIDLSDDEELQALMCSTPIERLEQQLKRKIS